jgi:ketosteroid isomerase-like protein
MTMNISCSNEIDKSESQKIINLEKSAIEQWNKGNPSGFLDIMASDVVYFDDLSDLRIDGLGKIKQLYESIRGQIHVDKYEMINPKVQSVKDMALLTYNLISYAGKKIDKWNCTEVYRLEKDGNWRIIHSHWSFAKPNLVPGSVVKDFITAINGANIEKIGSLMTDDHIFVDSQDNKSIGKDKMKQAWVGYFELFPDYKIEITETFEKDSLICIIGYASATYKNLKNSSNTNHWRIPAAWKAIIQDNKIKHWQVYADNIVVMDIINRNK